MSVIAPLTDEMREEHELALGAVVPIDRYLGSERAFERLGHGGALYLTAEVGDATWLVAVLEAPERARTRRGDTRPEGWYALPNVVPITDLSPLNVVVRKAKALTAKLEAAIRRLIDEEDAPIITAPAAPKQTTVVDPKSPPLDRAVAHLANGDVVDAIAAMIQAWTAVRDPELANLIDRATRLLPSYDRPLLTTRYADRVSDKTWKAALADWQATLPQILQNAGTPPGGAIARCTDIEKLPPDPRIARSIIGSLGEYGGFGWGPASDVILRVKDTRYAKTVAVYEPILETDEFYDDTRDKLVALFDFARDPDPPGTVDRARLEDIARACEALEAPRRTECSLIDAIVEHPKDPAVYQIYADWLLDRQHPRGEHIALETQKASSGLSPASARRLGALEDVPFLFGAIDEIAASLRRERTRGIDRTLVVSWTANAVKWENLAVQPLARAIQTIEMMGNLWLSSPVGLASFMLAAPHLEKVSGVPRELQTKLAKLVGDRFVAKGQTFTRA